MSLPTNTTVQIEPRIDGDADPWGNPDVGYGPAGRALDAWLTQTSSVEVTVGTAETAVSDWLLAIPDYELGADVDPHHLDRVVDASGRTFAVLGEPEDAVPISGATPNHIEVRLRIVS